MPAPRLTKILLTALVLAPVPPALACATCGCTVSADAATGYSVMAGWQLNLDYTFINQDQLRHGSGTATPQQVVDNPSVPGQSGGEIERQTISRYVTASLIYRPDSRWSVDLAVPYVDRTHSTFGNQPQPFDSSETNPAGLSHADVSGLGDIRVIAAWQGFLPTRNLGVQLGLKLPTGAYGGPRATGSGNAGHPVYFGGTGNAAGTPLDTGLQAGTGSTDLLAGAYYYQPVSQDFDVFINGQFQAALVHALDQPGENFRPGNLTTVSAGLRDEANPAFVPQVQLNYSDKRADQGALADNPDTAGRVVYLSPGFTARLDNTVHVYGFVQLPVYSRLDGYQLFPHVIATAGLSYAF